MKKNRKKSSDGSVTTELLSEIYRNVSMGSENLASVVPHIKDKFLLTNVTSQLESYADFTRETEKLIGKRNEEPEKPSIMKKAMSRGGILLNTAFDSSTSHIAEMIEKGTTMGADKLEQMIAKCENAECDRDAAALGKRVVEYERGESRKMGEFMD